MFFLGWRDTARYCNQLELQNTRAYLVRSAHIRDKHHTSLIRHISRLASFRPQAHEGEEPAEPCQRRDDGEEDVWAEG